MFEGSGLISVTDHLGHLFLLFLSFKFRLLCLKSPTKRDPWKPKPPPTSVKTGPQAPLSLPATLVLPCDLQVLSVESLCSQSPPTVTAEGVCNHSKEQQDGYGHTWISDGRDPTEQ